jgi:CxxC-x17-CxxC domain-containing protein
MKDFKKSGKFSDRGAGKFGSRGPRKFGDRSSFGDRSASRPSFGVQKRWDDKPSRGTVGPGGKLVLHRATCSTCGQNCEVPFRPSEDRPVFCKNCFDKNDTTAKGGRGMGSRSFSTTVPPDPRIDDLKKQVESLTYKVEKLIKMLQPAAPVSVDMDSVNITDDSSEYVVRSSFTPKKFVKKGLKKVVKKKKK